MLILSFGISHKTFSGANIVLYRIVLHHILSSYHMILEWICSGKTTINVKCLDITMKSSQLIHGSKYFNI